MTYVICEPCIGVKDRSCVDECPVDCIYEGEDQLFIHPDEWNAQFFADHPDASGGASESPFAPSEERGGE
jgi:NAD-dependent dihydropyrimidine dehydrogenase PreA subunit